jgi:hypothetical protein
MIIWIGCALPVQAAVLTNADGSLPTPTAFATQMELGDLAQAKAWLAAGLPPDFMGSRIGSGLMIGAWEGNVPLMQLFLAQGADINRVNANGESALALAAWRGQTAAVNWLLGQGAQINAGARRWSALHYAVFAGHESLAADLMARGADVNAISPNGSSVLMMAVYEGREALARTLIEKGADRRVKNDWNDGALEWAMRANRLNIARMVSNPEEFNIAVSQPKESWGEAPRSLFMSKALEDLLTMRQTLAERKMSTDLIDRRIAAERMRIVRSTLDQPAKPHKAVTLEVSASRSKADDQSVRIVPSGQAAPPVYKVPPATYFGQPRMPVKAPTRNY